MYGERGPRVAGRLASWGQAVVAACVGPARDAYARMRERVGTAIEILFRWPAGMRPSPKGKMALADWVVPVHYVRREVRFPNLRPEPPPRCRWMRCSTGCETAPSKTGALCWPRWMRS